MSPVHKEPREASPDPQDTRRDATQRLPQPPASPTTEPLDRHL